MAIPGFRPKNTDDRVLGDTAAGLAQLSTYLQAIPLLDYRIIRDLSFKAGTDLAITHRLGRVPDGWWCIGQRGQFAVFKESDTPNMDRAKAIILQASTNVLQATFMIF